MGRLRRAIGRSAHRVKASFRPGGLILLYHRIAEMPSDPQLLCVTPQHFAEHLEVLRQYARPLSLMQLVEASMQGTIPRRAIAVTFDDGYADNLHRARPSLEQHDIPATVFVTSAYTEQQREFWWDELEKLLLQPGVLPQTLRLTINGTHFEWGLGEDAAYGPSKYLRHRGWNTLDRDVPGRRQRLYHSLCERLNPLTDQQRHAVLTSLRAWAGAQPNARPTHRPLLREELAQLAEADLIEIGAHTATHPLLSTLPAEAQRLEITQSKIWLEGVLGHPVRCFSYPYGNKSSYGAETVGIIKRNGFVCACANFYGLVFAGTDRFQLPRVIVRDWTANELADRLHKWFRG